MRYTDVEESIRQWAAAADGVGRRRMATYAAEELTRFDDLEAVAAAEFTPEAATAFLTACANLTKADASTIDDWLRLIDAGTLSDGDMDTEALRALTTVEAWRDFLRTGDSAPVASLAITLLEVIDFEVDADLDDFLADPRMSARYSKIQALLTQEGQH
ncbi:hypothetical protein ASE14_07820 [Agromyces sp. Root81]|uniref:hypothetical protein n=1 Tax=Agromyces sp. Root81 TaxID=1736601 RepID=UPI0006F2235A|nr:hypothetical protein [Agromyces sp. Root81]KRC60863.1 hypothetical protein ASE14_07820 [Agromyces sp. Root81]